MSWCMRCDLVSVGLWVSRAAVNAHVLSHGKLYYLGAFPKGAGDVLGVGALCYGLQPHWHKVAHLCLMPLAPNGCIKFKTP